MDKMFWSVEFPLFLTLIGGLIYVHYILHLGESYPRIYALIDPQNKCLPMKLIKPVHFEIS